MMFQVSGIIISFMECLAILIARGITATREDKLNGNFMEI